MDQKFTDNIEKIDDCIGELDEAIDTIDFIVNLYKNRLKN